MDLDDRTDDVLDWSVIREALAEHARTGLGAAACRALGPLPDAATVHRIHDGVAEVLAVRDEDESYVPLGAISDVGPLAQHAAKGETLDLASLREVGATLVALRRLARTVLGWRVDRPVLQDLAGRIVLDLDLVGTLEEAFDEEQRLSAAVWPVLGELRKRIDELHGSIRSTLDDLLRDESMSDLLQDDYVTQRRDRYVLPVKSRAKRQGLGIVHGTSGSGATVYIEPQQVVELNNSLRVAEGELEAEEARIRGQLSRWIGGEAEAIATAVRAAVRIDLLVARADLAEQLEATRPQVRTEGVVALKQARHPVLLLREVEVVPNDLRVDGDHPALVLSGPNAGGKTVALKTLGLCAMLVRVGCFVPAEQGSRVDWFEQVWADVGDPQAIERDLSSFSGHLLVLREMLSRTGPGTLLLLDEIATGTDPGQGAALARALLEALLDRGARAVVTTHYAQLKGLATVDDRFAIAAMEYAGDRPTYRVVPGVSGESHAFGIAERMGIEPDILERARALQGESERAFTEALEELEIQREQASRQAREAEARAADLTEQRERLAAREAKLKERAREMERREAAEFLDKVKQAERAIGKVVAELQRAPSHEGVQRARERLQELRDIVPDEPDDDEETFEAPELERGDRVKLRKLGREGEVVSVGEGSIQVNAGGLTVTVKPDEVERLGGKAPPPRRRRPKKKKNIRRPTKAPGDAVRHPGNTVDLRGMRVDEAITATEQFLDRAVREQTDIVFVLHGHGTGALKQAIRRWLPGSGYVAKSQPAGADQGGDAFTVAVLK